MLDLRIWGALNGILQRCGSRRFLATPQSLLRGEDAPFHRHLLGIEGLSPDDINHVLDLADGNVELNRQTEKKRSLLRDRTIINWFAKREKAEALPSKRRYVEFCGKSARRQVTSETTLQTAERVRIYPPQYARMASCSACTLANPRSAAAALSPPNCRASAETLWP
jgi:hypothetical protein